MNTRHDNDERDFVQFYQSRKHYYLADKNAIHKPRRVS
jgi:hypothetical protein